MGAFLKWRSLGTFLSTERERYKGNGLQSTPDKLQFAYHSPRFPTRDSTQPAMNTPLVMRAGTEISRRDVKARMASRITPSAGLSQAGLRVRIAAMTRPQRIPWKALAMR